MVCSLKLPKSFFSPTHSRVLYFSFSPTLPMACSIFFSVCSSHLMWSIFLFLCGLPHPIFLLHPIFSSPPSSSSLLFSQQLFLAHIMCKREKKREKSNEAVRGSHGSENAHSTAHPCFLIFSLCFGAFFGSPGLLFLPFPPSRRVFICAPYIGFMVV